MEIFELRYFLGVAAEQNIHRASERLHVSPGSLSKAISRLEEELKVRLFFRQGRNIRLSDPGRLFQKRAAEIVHLEESARMELAGHRGSLQVVIAGPEILLAEMGVKLSADLREKYPHTSFEFHAVDEQQAIGQVSRGEAHLGLSTSDVNPQLGLSSKVLSDPSFVTVVGAGHPLYTAAKSKKPVAVEKVLEYDFVSPNQPLLGKVGNKQSLDGWRDDQFPRRVAYLTSSLKILELLATRGQALAYLPDYYAKRIDVAVLKVVGCPYTCSQKVRLLSKNPQQRSWLKHWF